MFCLGTGLTSETKWLFCLFANYCGKMKKKHLTGYIFSVEKIVEQYQQTLLQEILRVLFASCSEKSSTNKHC